MNSSAFSSSTLSISSTSLSMSSLIFLPRSLALGAALGASSAGGRSSRRCFRSCSAMKLHPPCGAGASPPAPSALSPRHPEQVRQLRDQQLAEGQADGRRGPRQAHDGPPLVEPQEAPAQHGLGPELLVAEGPEQLAEALQFLLQQG